MVNALSASAVADPPRMFNPTTRREADAAGIVTRTRTDAEPSPSPTEVNAAPPWSNSSTPITSSAIRNVSESEMAPPAAVPVTFSVSTDSASISARAFTSKVPAAEV